MDKPVIGGQAPDCIPAANAFRQEMLQHSDASYHYAPAWLGWAIVAAFEAGVAYERKKWTELIKESPHDHRP